MQKERIALVFGTFAPLHQGHIDLIQRAKLVFHCRNAFGTSVKLSPTMN